ncbi:MULTISPECIES: TerD family protein [Streptomyces]|uniref:Export associated protein n=2 Tax=Streptomyces TaxID=1883 RepID=A0A420VAE6_9ACTN|nr:MULTISPECIES: TerD family protein [Streptomyces]KNE83610.1 export associated protein [Streptomyces fradiae]OFA53349.1 export associated protein [Streptomyces fradiae]PQM25236.1 export associated protein [Streptomyces xinghaiensis]RKM99288.1 export associated protein [Streptomyces xinghaiensis]RNC75808.1 export associated protein [Streptomyces xinghaiensis]
MTAELVRGQNHPLTRTRLEIRISAGDPVIAGATLGDEDGRVAGPERVAHPAAPHLPGLEVPQQAAADHRLAVDLEALPEGVHRVTVLLALPNGVGGPSRFGTVAAPFVAVTGLDGTALVSFTITGLDAESAVTALELYRRRGAWKVRAVGQGYADGLAAMLRDQGLPQAAELAATVQEAVTRGMARTIAPPPRTPGDGTRVRTAAGLPPGESGPAPQPPPRPPAAPVPPEARPPQQQAQSGSPVDYRHPGRVRTAPPSPPPQASPPEPGRPPQPVAGDASGWTMDERLYNQVWGMFEDLARSVAAYRSAVDFADSRQEQELQRVLSDPRSRIGGAGDEARAAAGAKHTALVDRARAVLDRDLAQLIAESEVVEPALPSAFAGWASPVWHGYRVPMEIPMAMRLGDLHLPERPELRIPMLVRLPLERGLWIDSGRSRSGPDHALGSDGLRRAAVEAAVAHVARLLAVHPAGEFTVHVLDPAGSATASLAPLLESGVLREPPAAGAAGVTAVLSRLTRRVDLMQMAVRGGAPDALPPDLDTGEQLLLVNDFPHGFDDRAVTQLRYLADEGPSVGVHLMMVADREDAREYGPVLDPLWRSLLRITPVPDDHLADPWVGHAWTYEPALAPAGSRVLVQVLRQVAEARRAYGR